MEGKGKGEGYRGRKGIGKRDGRGRKGRDRRIASWLLWGCTPLN